MNNLTLEDFFDRPGHVMFLLDYGSQDRMHHHRQHLRHLLTTHEEYVASRLRHEELRYRLNLILLVLDRLAHSSIFGRSTTPSERMEREAVVRIRSEMLCNPHLDAYIVIRHLADAPHAVLRHPAVLLELSLSPTSMEGLIDGHGIMRAARFDELRSGPLAQLTAVARWQGIRADELKELPLEARRFIAKHATWDHIRVGLLAQFKEQENQHHVM